LTNKKENTAPIQQQLARLINTTNSLRSFVEQAFDLLFEGRKPGNFYLALYDSTNQKLTCPFHQGHCECEGSTALDAVNSPLQRVIQEQLALTVKASEYMNYCHDASLITHPPSLWVGLPLIIGTQVLGALVFIASDDTQSSEIDALQPFLATIPELLTPYLETRVQLDRLEESEHKFRRFVETSMDITFQVNGNGDLDYISSNLQDLLAIDTQFFIGKHIKTLTTEEHAPKLMEALRGIFQGETIRNLQVAVKQKTGEVLPMEVSASPIYLGDKITGAQGTLRDISEKNRAQQEIERLAFFPLANPMPIVELDLEGFPSYINPAGIQLLDRMNLDMSQVSQILPKPYKSDISSALSDKSQIPSREVSLEGFHFLWSAFFLENQNLLHYYATDITNLKNAEIELIAAKERALRNEEVKTLFLANMSHEIRTPLNSILGFTELIEEEVKDEGNSNLETYFETIYMSGKRLWDTVHHILDISQIETGTFELKTETIDLGRIARDLVSSYKSAAKAKHLELKIKLHAPEIHITSDEYCATQAISNLIDNAIKYTNSGSISLDSALEDGAVKITIKDTGIGMSKEYQDHMFNLFSQESTGYTKNFQGMGLGLALAHRYLMLINCKIQLESAQDVGTIFTIYFPVDASNSPVISNPESSDVPENERFEVSELSRISILVVEDDPNSQKLASFTLSKDYNLHFAESVADAKDVLNTHEVQLILLDLSLRGDEDGLELARFLRKDTKWLKVPIVALTAHAFTSDRDRCMEAGCNDFMTKPFRLADLKETILRLL